jgi:hypothetical protein
VAPRVFTWHAEHLAAGLQRDALYLLCPDSHIALADAPGTPEALQRYSNDRAIDLGAA